MLLEKSKVEAADILIRYLSRQRMTYGHIQRMDVDEISNLQISLYESGSETTKLKTRVTVGLIANDGKMECIVYEEAKGSIHPAT